MPRYDVFLSHASADKPAVEHLARKLPAGHKPGEEKLPRFFRGLTWVDFRAGLDDEDAFRRLLAGIRGKATGRRSGCWGGLCRRVPSTPST